MAQIFANELTDGIQEFDIKIHELGEDDLRAPHPPGTKVTLKPHQLTLLKRCIDMENGAIMLADYPHIANRVDPHDSLSTRIGIIGDRVGSGKSYVILALIQSNSLVDKEDVMVRSYGYNNVVFRLAHRKKILHTNLLVIPHNLTSQWTGYMETYSDGAIKYVVINKKTISDFLEGNIKVEDYDLVIVTATYFNRFATFFAGKGHRFQRVIFDEVDGLNIPGCRVVDCRFVWMVTASFGNVLYPRGFSRWEPTLHRYIWSANGITNSGYIKAVLSELSYYVPKKLTKLLILKNSDTFIEQSNHLPAIFKNVVRCKTPRSIHILEGIADRNIIECLNADDVSGAISYVSASNKGSEDNIVDLMIQKYSKAIINLNLKVDCAKEYLYETEQEREAEITKLQTKIKENELKVALIKERIKDSNTCSICYDDIDNKTVTNCCQNSFCFKCIGMWLMRKSLCPMCKSPMSDADIYSVVDPMQVDPAAPGPSTRQLEEDPSGDAMHHSFDKYKNLEILMTRRAPNSKFLIFSNYDTSFINVYPIMNRLGIKYMHLKGNGNVIKCMTERYKTGDVDVLLVNSRHYGSGLNLENTTDVVMFHKFDTEIEKQVIGRAHRLGRTAPLNVWYFLHDNEVHAVDEVPNEVHAVGEVPNEVHAVEEPVAPPPALT